MNLFVLLLAVFSICECREEQELSLLPEILKGPQSTSLLSGDELVLSCLAHAYPAPDLRIYRLSPYAEIQSADNFHSSEFDNELLEVMQTNAVEEDSTIEVTLEQNVETGDSGWYRCVASNEHGTVFEDAYVEVLDSFTEEPQHIGETTEPNLPPGFETYKEESSEDTSQSQRSVHQEERSTTQFTTESESTTQPNWF